MPTYTNCNIDQIDFRTSSFGRQVKVTGRLASGSNPTVTRWFKVPASVEMPLVSAKFHNRTVNAIVTTNVSGSEVVNQVNVL